MGGCSCAVVELLRVEILEAVFGGESLFLAICGSFIMASTILIRHDCLCICYCGF